MTITNDSGKFYLHQAYSGQNVPIFLGSDVHFKDFFGHCISLDSIENRTRLFFSPEQNIYMGLGINDFDYLGYILLSQYKYMNVPIPVSYLFPEFDDKNESMDYWRIEKNDSPFIKYLTNKNQIHNSEFNKLYISNEIELELFKFSNQGCLMMGYGNNVLVEKVKNLQELASCASINFKNGIADIDILNENEIKTLLSSNGSIEKSITIVIEEELRIAIQKLLDIEEFKEETIFIRNTGSFNIIFASIPEVDHCEDYWFCFNKKNREFSWINSYDFEKIRLKKYKNLFENIKNHPTGFNPEGWPITANKKRGTRIKPAPFNFSGGKNPELSVSHLAILCGKNSTTKKFNLIDGIKLDVTTEFDRNELVFREITTKQFQHLSSFEENVHKLVQNFFDSIKHTDNEPTGISKEGQSFPKKEIEMEQPKLKSDEEALEGPSKKRRKTRIVHKRKRDEYEEDGKNEEDPDEDSNPISEIL
jgi:hypothetical protein